MKTQSKPKEKGDCYVANGKAFLDMKHQQEDVKTYLVHGIVTNAVDGKPMGHCWIEHHWKLTKTKTEILVEDLSNSRRVLLTKNTYYTEGSIEESNVIRYDLETYRRKLVETGTWGHWELKVNR